MQAEVRAQFRLMTDNLNQDIARARETIQREMGKGFKGGGTGGLATSPADTIRQMAGAKAISNEKERQYRREEYMERIRKSRVADEKKLMTDRSKFMADMSFLAMPLMNPGSMWATLFSTRQTFRAFSGTDAGKAAMGKLGLSGIGGAATMTAGLVGGATALGVAFMGLKKTVNEVMNSFERARSLYAKSLMSGGLNLSFISRRSMVADAMGVSESELLKFGYAFNYLNPKLAWASNIIAKTTPNLASVGWEFRVLKDNMQAMFATIANDAAPAMRKFVDGLSEFIKISTDWYDKYKSSVGTAAKGYALGSLAMIDPMSATYALLLGMKISSMGKDSGPAPEPLASMKQLKASSWERMGFVIGLGGGTNPAKETANNTKNAVAILTQIHAALIPRSGGASVINPAQNYQ